MLERSAERELPPVRIGAVSYLNARPLTLAIPRFAPSAEITFDLPSRLADRLAAGQLDVALIPSIDYFRNPEWTVVSDACVACDGPVRSVKLFGRVPIEQIRTLALDEGSRTSAALVRIMLRERFGVEPQLCLLPIGTSPEDSQVDATMLIGDRAMLPWRGRYEFVWDLGHQWSQWTGLPFVFAMWIARSGVDLQGIDQVLRAARDEGVAHLGEIARDEAPGLGLPENDCLEYLRDNLDFQLNDRQRQGLHQFCELAARHRLAPAGVELVI